MSVNAVLRANQNGTFTEPSNLSVRSRKIKRSGSGYGSKPKQNRVPTLKIEVFAPMPSPSQNGNYGERGDFAGRGCCISNR
jgi:hypothetical protein